MEGHKIKQLFRRGMGGVMACLMFANVLQPTTDQVVYAAEENTIISFERMDPVEWLTVDVGTQEEDLELPGTLRAIVSLDEVDMDTFVQAEPQAYESDDQEDYDYYYYGYVAPRDKEELYEADELAIYTIYYAGEGDQNMEVVDQAYRLYGSLDGGNVSWYSCTEDGTITGLIETVSMSWSSEDYDSTTPGEYVFTGTADDCEMECSAPTTKVTVSEAEDSDTEESDAEEVQDPCDEEPGETVEVEDTDTEETDETEINEADESEMEAADLEDAELIGEELTEEETEVILLTDEDCTCDAAEGSRAWEHDMDCPLFEPVQCMCEGDNGHDEENMDCPLYGADVIELYRPDGETLVLGRLDELENFEAAGFVIPEEPVIHYAVSLLSTNGNSGTVDTKQDTYMKNNTPTSGTGTGNYTERGGYQVPWSWIYYMNTVWMNQGYNGFAWATTSDMNNYSSSTYSSWYGSVAYSSLDPTQNDYGIPKKSTSGYWEIYSGEQLRYAMLYCSAGDKIRLQKNLNMRGYSCAWSPILAFSKGNITLDGNGYSIYNLGIYTADTTAASLKSSFTTTGTNESVQGSIFVDYGQGSCYKDLKFYNAKLVAFRGSTDENNASTTSNSLDYYYRSASLFGSIGYERLEGIYVKDSLVYGGPWTSVIATHGRSHTTNNAALIGSNATYDVVKNCYIESCMVYGTYHVASLGSMICDKTVSNCYTKDTLIVGVGMDVGGFTSCGATTSTFTDCFVSNGRVYGSGQVGGFIGQNVQDDFNGCFASGMTLGIFRCGGFMGHISIASTYKKATSFTNCYSTMLVGLQKETNLSGGFLGAIINSSTATVTIDSCYAAGEVGSSYMDMDNNTEKNGGFVGSVGSGSLITYNNCYYDKQTTAMREWATGTTKVTGSETASSIQGVLTTTTTKGGTGLASGSTGTTGFAGFTTSSKWSLSAGRYPQLTAFSGATSTKWCPSAYHLPSTSTSAVSAASRGSTATVMLNTWDSGVNFSIVGGKSTKAYTATTSSFSGGATTYDTVRDIMAEGTATTGTYWTEQISGGAPTDVDGDGTADGRSVLITGSGSGTARKNTLTVEQPGLNWYEVSTSSSTTVATAGKRPIRLISLMQVDAGEDKTVLSGELYDHRSDVSLTMVDTLTEHLLIGKDDSQIWSTSAESGYPSSTGYWGVSNSKSTHYLVGSGSSRDTKIYTAVYYATEDSSGTITEKALVYMGSETSSWSTAQQRARNRWNGSVPMYTDISTGRVYVVKYYWQVADGRYVTDSKVIRVMPNTYNLYMYVRNLGNGIDTSNSTNSSALYVTAAQADSSTGIASYTYQTSTRYYTATTSVPYTRNTVAAWKVKNGYRVTGLKILIYDKQGTAVGTASLTEAIQEGTTITIPVTYPYYYTSASGYEYAYESTVNVTYTVKKDDQGGYYLSFNKLLNAPTGETAEAKLNGDSTGIGSTSAYINDMQNNVSVTLYVSTAGTLTVKKQVDTYGDTDKAYDIDVTLSSGSGGSGTLYSGDVTVTQGSTTSVMTATNGKLTLSLKSGESATITGIPLNQYYKVQEQDASKTGYTVTYNNAGTTSSSTYVTGQLTSTTAKTVTVNNTLQKAGTLSVYKTLTGTNADTSQDFLIDVQVSKKSDYSDTSLNGSFAYSTYTNNSAVASKSGNLTFTNGKATITLKGGEFIAISNLPSTYYYKITEQSSSQEGYTVTYTNQSGQLTTSNQNAYVKNEVKTASLTFVKVADENKKGLSGAKFSLYRLIDSTKYNSGTLIDTAKIDTTQWTLVGSATSNPKVEFADLTKGTYRLVETSAPDGRIMPEVQWNVVVDGNMNITITDTAGNKLTKAVIDGYTQSMYYITNKMLYELPSAGSIGTYWFTIGGFAIMMTALLLFMKKRKEAGIR